MIFAMMLAFATGTFSPSDTVDSAWLSRAISRDYDTSPEQLVYEFSIAHPSDIFSNTSIESNRQPYLDITSVDLDGDGQPECLMFIGPQPESTMFCVIKRFGRCWRLIYYQDFPMHGEIEPEVSVLDTPSKYKTFYLKWYYFSGTGNWLYTYRFYKVIGGQVVQVLEFVENSNLAHCLSDITAQMTASCPSEDISIMPPFNETLSVRYQYSISKTGCYTNRPTKIEPNDVPLFKDDNASSTFDWDPKQLRFVLHTFAHNNGLTEEQMKFFFNLGDDKLFVKVFSDDLKQLTIFGDDTQKKWARYFLKKYGK